MKLLQQERVEWNYGIICILVGLPDKISGEGFLRISNFETLKNISAFQFCFFPLLRLPHKELAIFTNLHIFFKFKPVETIATVIKMLRPF